MNEYFTKTQLDQIFKFGESKFDLKEEIVFLSLPNKTLFFRLAPFYNAIGENEISQFLDYQFGESDYKDLLIYVVYCHYKGSYQGKPLLDGNRKELIQEWLSSKYALPEHVIYYTFQYFNLDKKYKPADLAKWLETVNIFLQGKPEIKQLEFLKYGLEFLKQGYQLNIEHEKRHLKNFTENSRYSLSFQNRIDHCQTLIKKLETPKSESMTEINDTHNPEFTTARQVLAIYYMLLYMKVEFEHVNKTDIARLIQFLTNKEAKNEKISNTTIYKKVKKIITKTDKNQVQNLQYIKLYFSKLHLEEIVKMIDNDIASYKR